MKKLFTSSFLRTYFILITGLLTNEIIFRLLKDLNLFSYQMIRIILFYNIISLLIALMISYMNNIVRKIIYNLLLLGAIGYSFFQLGFISFIGVYASINSSSHLGAVTDYIVDFFKSFKLAYYIILLPIILIILYAILIDKKGRKSKFKKVGIFSFIMLILSISGFYYMVVNEKFQSKFQTMSNKDLFITGSNPSLAVDQYGIIGFLFLDLKSYVHPVELEAQFKPVINNNASTVVTDYTRHIDDDLWKELIEEEKNSTLNSLNNYFINQKITDKNEYTGMFEGKNLIVILMESVNDIILNKEYYPNFNRLLQNGWHWENNYSPRNSCATMNNEFSGMVSLYSIANMCTANTYKNNKYEESIFGLFNKSKYTTFSAHDYGDLFYARSVIHPNMGSGKYYNADSLGITWYTEYENWASDEDFMAQVLKLLDTEYKDEKFMTWLTTVSPHQPYGSSSIEGDKYLDLTSGTGYNMYLRRYASKLKTFDNALGILLDGLEERGILEDTVIVLYGNHYPYGMSPTTFQALLDYNASEDLNMEQTPLVIYNSNLEAKTFSDYTTYIDILPTIANLFNLDYDPRLYIGSDLLSEDHESIAVFADGSWKNEYAFYDSKTNKIKYYTDFTYTDEEIQAINNDIANKMNVSASIIKNDYFNYLNTKLGAKREIIKKQKEQEELLKRQEEEQLKEESDNEKNKKKGE